MRASLSRGEKLSCEQDDAYGDEEDCEPAASVYVFPEEDFGCGSVADVGERGGGGCGE